ncbi:Glutamine--scyllo-inositol transaminase [Rhodospirillaceae bacterium LM-1]|nr:Glutamine--scyllo-inositol transaminase [Rhodospirillaceae bacterium LM-1]
MTYKSTIVPLMRPSIGDEEAAAIAEVLKTGWVTQGIQVASFEEEFAAFVGAPHACAVSSCTAALHLALLGIGVGPGDEVLTVSHSFIATANAVRYTGALPVFVDIGSTDYNMDTDLLEAAITSKTKAILAVHQLGMPCNLEKILSIAHSHKIPVIEDAACAIGSEIFLNGGWQRIGAPMSDAACFSFHPRKVITTGDGGMVTTRHAELANRLKRLRQHAMTVSDLARSSSSAVSLESYDELGFNYRMTDIQAAMGRVQLSRLPEIVARRRALAASYEALLEGVPGLAIPRESDWARSNWQTYCVRLPALINQRETMQKLLDLGVATRRAVMCAHREPAYRDLKPRFPLTNSEYAQDHGIMIPLFGEMTDANQKLVAKALFKVLTERA